MSSLDHVRWLSKPSLKQPVIVTAFTGWNDAADASSNAVRNLIEGWHAQPLAEIDPEQFTDFATIRPHVRLKEGGARSIVWPTVGLWHVSGAGGDIILVLGPEPSLKWRTFSEQLMGVADHFGSSMMLTLGALLADVPHSRPVQIIGTATDDDLIDRFELQRSRYEGPTGIVGVLHDSCYAAAMPSAALWAAVPAYASQVPSPKASLSLMRRACEIIGTPAPVASVMNLIERYEEQVNSLVEDDEDLAAYVERLETM
ncbi:MAG: PAC2 family protein, partial [Ilumatobacteraceae bacterium]